MERFVSLFPSRKDAVQLAAGEEEIRLVGLRCDLVV